MDHGRLLGSLFGQFSNAVVMTEKLNRLREVLPAGHEGPAAGSGSSSIAQNRGNGKEIRPGCSGNLQLPSR